MYKYTKSLSIFIFLGLFITHNSFATDITSLPETATVTAVVGNFTVTPTDGGGSGIPTGLMFSGFAYPGATIYILKNSNLIKTTIADIKGGFNTTLDTETYSTNPMYTLYAVDKNGKQSLLMNYPIILKNDWITEISGIRFPPTVMSDKTEVRSGDSITISGYAVPNTLLDVVLENEKDTNILFHLLANVDGTYSITIPLRNLEKGDYMVHVNYKNDIKPSKVIGFTIGDTDIPSTELIINIPGDCNADQAINLVDFSVMAFWYGKSNPPVCTDTNTDNKIDLIDFSILAFYWTG